MNINWDKIPQKPGIYIWKDKYGNFIYVGKAKNLRKRMKQYFVGMLNSYKTSRLVEQIEDFEIVVTKTEQEALILERNYIEKYSPEFNILMTDDKRYPYIKVSLKDKLYISLAYRIRTDRDKNALFYGPYPNGSKARKLANLLTRMTSYEKGLPIKSEDREMWKQKFEFVKKTLSQGTAALIKSLKNNMLEASKNEQYEIAQDLKDTIESLELNQENQSVEFLNTKNIDVISFVEKDQFISISMLFYRRGALISNKDFVIEVTNKDESIRQFISQYYTSNIKPDLIITNEKIETDMNFEVPKKGKKKQVLLLAEENAKTNIEFKLNSFLRKEEQTMGSIRKLEKLIGTNKISHIMMIDNSNTNNTLPVSVLVSYRNGIKQKKEYRKYNLELTNRKSDVDYMKQGLEKYFSKKENAIPDLLIVDGGKAQISEAKKYTPNDLKIIGLVKDDKHKTESLIDLQGNKHKINDQLLHNFLSEMQVEVDRFAKYHHANRRKTTLEGKLIEVPGIGPAKEKQLLKRFKTYANIYNASIEELKEIVSEEVAKSIKVIFQ